MTYKINEVHHRKKINFEMKIMCQIMYTYYTYVTRSLIDSETLSKAKKLFAYSDVFFILSE